MKRGFTLIELLVVIAIISILSSVALATLDSARAQARDSQRISDLRQLGDAVERFYLDKGVYPDSGGVWRREDGCTGANYYGYDSDGYIPGLVPEYMPVLPADPKPGVYFCYMYKSDGTDYMVMVHQTVETFDPDDGPHPFDRPLTDQQSIAVYSSGAVNW